MVVPHDPMTEFRFLAGDATRVSRATPLPNVERVSVQVSDGRALSSLTYTERKVHGTGDSNRPPRFVFLHGAGLNAHAFDPTVLALSVNAISIDLPGHGRSDWREDADYNPTNLAADVAIALRELAVEPVHLVGHSLGGLTAGLVATQCSSMVKQMTIIDITPGITPTSDAKSVSDFITGQRNFASVDEIVDRAIEFGIGTDRKALTRGVELNTRTRADGTLEWTHHFAHLDGLPSRANTDGTVDSHPYANVWEPLRDMSDDVSLIRGTAGMVSDALVAEWRDELPTSPVVTIEGGHNLHEQAPRPLAHALLELDR